MKGLHLYETDMHKIALILIITSFLLLPSCKDDEQTEPVWDPSGLYNVSIKVERHSPNIQYNGNDTLLFRHQIIRGHAFDTVQRKCCEWRLTDHNCPDNYTLYNLRIFKSGSQYYLFGKQSFSTEGIQTSFHVPLNYTKTTLSLDPLIVSENQIYQISSVNSMSSSAYNWPFYFHFIEFNLEYNENVITGNWIARDMTGTCNTKMSDGSTQSYRTTEFADITFTRIGN